MEAKARAAIGTNIAVPTGIINSDGTAGLVIGAIPQVGNVLVAREAEVQSPAINRTAAVGDGDVGGEAAAPIIGNGVVYGAVTNRL